jgi:hypothetical protein
MVKFIYTMATIHKTMTEQKRLNVIAHGMAIVSTFDDDACRAFFALDRTRVSAINNIDWAHKEWANICSPHDPAVIVMTMDIPPRVMMAMKFGKCIMPDGGEPRCYAKIDHGLLCAQHQHWLICAHAIISSILCIWMAEPCLEYILPDYHSIELNISNPTIRKLAAMGIISDRR